MNPEDQLVRLAQGWVGGGPTLLIKLCLFDWAACAIAGQQEDAADILLARTEAEGPCSIFGAGTSDAATAALINGTMGHALDYDDTHFDHIGHTSAVIMPAVLAVTQENLAGTGALLDAALLGSEAAVRTGLWLGRDHYQVGFHQTATAGAFGATVALARLKRLNRQQTKHAIGLTATMASGLKGQFGTMGKPLNAGLAARAAIESVTWAQAGFTADPQGLQTFGATHHGIADESAWDDGEPWKIARISHKFHACCHGLHAMLEALHTLSLDPENIEGLRIKTHPRWMSVCNQSDPDTGLGAKFSYRQTAAMALLGVSTAAIDNFNDAIARDPKPVALRQKVSVLADTELSEMQSDVVVQMKDGTSRSATFDLDTSLTLQERETRLMHKAGALLGQKRAEALWSAINSGSPDALFDV